MRRVLTLVVAGALLTACTSEPQRSEEAFVAATADIPGEPRAKLIIGDLICGEINGQIRGSSFRDAQKLDLIDDLTGEIYNTDQAAVLVDAADIYLCP